ncbi:MAG TPA: hypothetical protein VHM67_15600, partial [Gemmatimonadaceae bacterium]|nr:hypothetical protein [Gemmatimonadaceae bacterium]
MKVLRTNARQGFQAFAALTLALGARGVGAQTQLPAGTCDFDIADDLGAQVYGSTMHLTGRPGAATNRGHFFLINADSAYYDVDRDGYNQPGTACNFTAIYTPIDLRGNLINVADPSQVIPADNIILLNLPRLLPNGTMARVDAFVEVPRGAIAGRYIGAIQVRDSIYGVRNSPAREVLAADRIFFEVVVTEQRAFALVDPDRAAILDSVVIRGRAGSRASGVFRLANLGNTPLADVRLAATDLRSESAVGLVIPAQNITFSTAQLPSVQVGDTARITITVQIPRG